MNKGILLVGIIGLFIGLFVIDYFVIGIPIITSISGFLTILGLLLNRNQDRLSTVTVPHTSSCPNCGEPTFPKQKFCGMCGQSIVLRDETKTLEDTVTASISPGVNVSASGNLGRAFLNLIIPRTPLIKVTNTIYEKLSPVSLFGSIRLLVVTVILFAGFYLLYFGGQAFSIIDSNLLYFVATYSVAFFYLIWIYRSDKYEREPFQFVLFVFAWGVFSGILAAPLNEVIGPFFQASFGNAALVGPFTEEPLKAIGLFYFITREKIRNEFNTPLDGIVYGFATGMGFFAMENFIYFLNPEGGSAVLIFRSLLVWGHGVWVATTGLWLAIAKVQRGYLKKMDLIPGLAVAIFLHFIWNGWVGFLGPELGTAALIGHLIFHLWYTRKIIREATRDEVLWGFGQGLAPLE